MSIFNYEWYIKDGYPAKGVKYHGSKVFSCFACGGGSTMGYKLAGYDVIGCNEIDPKMNEVYVANHNPKFNYLEPIQTFKNRKDLPQELYSLDILDGSPPCSSFSMAGNREKDWGKEKVFREGQSEQVLDTLFFDFIDLARELKPKVVIAENVKGLLLGEAKQYVINIYSELEKAGYMVQHFLLDASKMGVPQKRERVFFIALRKDLCSQFLKQVDMFTILPEIKLSFNEKEIVYGDIKTSVGKKSSDLYYSRWEKRISSDNDFGDITQRLNGTGSCYSDVFCKPEKVMPTITAKGGMYDFDTGHFISDDSFIKSSSFPLDYKFINAQVSYIVGMSVPPLMTAQISNEVYKQWISKF